MYIVIFNLGYKDSEILTNSNGFVEEFPTTEDARQEAKKWIDKKQYRCYNIYEQQ